jgi:hypothetical protein
MNRSETKKDYKQTKRPMGVYRIRNTKDGKSYIGFSTDLQAIINRHKTELNFGSHRNTELMGEWKSLGESSFEFEVLDELERDENSKTTPAEELRILHEMWLHKIEKTGDLIVKL